MKEVRISDLKQGTIAEVDYYGRDGKILIKKSVNIDDALLSAINRRNITKFYIQEEGEDIKKLLSLQELDHFELEDDLPSETDTLLNMVETATSAEPTVAPEKALPALAGVKRGEEGVRQMLKSQTVQSLEEAIEKSAIPLTVLPEGTPVKELAKEIEVGARTEDYKTNVLTDFDKSVEDIRNLFSSIRNGRTVQSSRIINIVKGFTKTFLNDKHMLLNLANSKSKEDDYLYTHSLNVTLISISIAASRGFDENQIVEVGVGALLHDVGALFISEEIRFKKEPLTRDEIFEVQKHPMVGIHIVEKIKGLPPSTPYICYQSHERENREGYPKQRNGRLIHDYAKIVMVADVYESLTSERPYRRALVPYKAMEYVLKGVKHGLFNAEIVKYYLEYTSLFPVGSLVMLNTGEIAKVVKPNGSLYSRPWVSIIVGADSKLIPQEQIRNYDLKVLPDMKITQAIDNSKLNIEVMRGF